MQLKMTTALGKTRIYLPVSDLVLDGRVIVLIATEAPKTSLHMIFGHINKKRKGEETHATFLYYGETRLYVHSLFSYNTLRVGDSTIFVHTGLAKFDRWYCTRHIDDPKVPANFIPLMKKNLAVSFCDEWESWLWDTAIELGTIKKCDTVTGYMESYKFNPDYDVDQWIERMEKDYKAGVISDG